MDESGIGIVMKMKMMMMMRLSTAMAWCKDQYGNSTARTGKPAIHNQ